MFNHTRPVARLVSSLIAVAAGMTLVTAPAAYAAAGPLPPTFQIRNNYFSQCAYPRSDAPHGLRMDPCSAADLSERWMFDPITQQVTNGRDATRGLCLTGTTSVEGGVATMATCDSEDPIQRWELFEYNGSQYLAQANGSGMVLTARASGIDWHVFPWTGDNTQKMVFPIL